MTVPPLNTALRRKRRSSGIEKHVRFASANSHGPSRGPLTKEEIDDVWYTDEEHDGMRYQAREDCWKMMSQVQRSPRDLDDDNEPPCYRGLEARVSFKRAHDRRVVVRAVIEVQSRLRDGRAKTKHDPALVLGMLAAKLTKDARTEANEVGNADFREAHGTSTIECSPAPLRAVSATIPQSRKRRMESVVAEFGEGQEGAGRNVRMRIEIEAAAS